MSGIIKINFADAVKLGKAERYVHRGKLIGSFWQN